MADSSLIASVYSAWNKDSALAPPMDPMEDGFTKQEMVSMTEHRVHKRAYDIMKHYRSLGQKSILEHVLMFAFARCSIMLFNTLFEATSFRDLKSEPISERKVLKIIIKAIYSTRLDDIKKWKLMYTQGILGDVSLDHVICSVITSFTGMFGTVYHNNDVEKCCDIGESMVHDMALRMGNILEKTIVRP